MTSGDELGIASSFPGALIPDVTHSRFQISRRLLLRCSVIPGHDVKRRATLIRPATHTVSPATLASRGLEAITTIGKNQVANKWFRIATFPPEAGPFVGAIRPEPAKGAYR